MHFQKSLKLDSRMKSYFFNPLSFGAPQSSSLWVCDGDTFPTTPGPERKAQLPSSSMDRTCPRPGHNNMDWTMLLTLHVRQFEGALLWSFLLLFGL